MTREQKVQVLRSYIKRNHNIDILQILDIRDTPISYDSPSSLLISSNSWTETPQGFRFWDRIHSDLYTTDWSDLDNRLQDMLHKDPRRLP